MQSMATPTPISWRETKGERPLTEPHVWRGMRSAPPAGLVLSAQLPVGGCLLAVSCWLLAVCCLLLIEG